VANHEAQWKEGNEIGFGFGFEFGFGERVQCKVCWWENESK
jgi:hypothetical protein